MFGYGNVRSFPSGGGREIHNCVYVKAIAATSAAGKEDACVYEWRAFCASLQKEGGRISVWICVLAFTNTLAEVGKDACVCVCMSKRTRIHPRRGEGMYVCVFCGSVRALSHVAGRGRMFVFIHESILGFPARGRERMFVWMCVDVHG